MTERTRETRATYVQRKREEAERRRAAASTNWAEENDRRKDCAHETRTGLTAAKLRNGALTFYDRCDNCGKTLQVYKHEAIEDPASVPIERDDTFYNPPCQVCGTLGTELHHWAPKEFFDWEADAWPTAWLCVECHARWHRIMKAQVPYKARQQLNLEQSRGELAPGRGRSLGPFRGPNR